MWSAEKKKRERRSLFSSLSHTRLLCTQIRPATFSRTLTCRRYFFLFPRSFSLVDARESHARAFSPRRLLLLFLTVAGESIFFVPPFSFFLLQQQHTHTQRERIVTHAAHTRGDESAERTEQSTPFSSSPLFVTVADPHIFFVSTPLPPIDAARYE